MDGRDQHRDWLSLVEVDGPFLTLPVLLRVWPTLDAVDTDTRERLRDVLAYAETKPRAWIEYVVAELLGWEGLATWAPVGLDWRERDHEVDVRCDFAWPGTGQERPYLLGYVVDSRADPRGRVPEDDWPATWTDRAAVACRGLGVPLALVTNGRLWCLVWAPADGPGAVVTFDTATWDDSADRVVVRAFTSLLHRSRFTSVPPEQMLDALLRESLDAQEDITLELGRNVRRAVELVVESLGRWDAREAGLGRRGLGDVEPHEVYGGAVTLLMRLMFLFFAEERGLLPADNPVYADGYGASTLCERLEIEAVDTGEEALEHRSTAWLRLLATSQAVHGGVDAQGFRLPAYDGSLFRAEAHPWLAGVTIDDRTMLHVLRSVQYVVIRRERRRVSFRSLEVEQIGYVYEGLLAYDAERAAQWTLGLVGKAGLEEEVPLPELERRRGRHTDPDTGVVDTAALAAELAEDFKTSGIGTAKRLAGLLAPLPSAEQARALPRLLAVTEGDRGLAERVLPFAGLVRDDLRGLPTVIQAGSLYVTASAGRAQSGTHYTPSPLAREVTERTLWPLVDREQPSTGQVSSRAILRLKVADITVGSGAFLVAACRFLGDRLVDAWADEGDPEAEEYLRRTIGGEALTLDGSLPPVISRARRRVISHCLYGVDVNPMAVEMAKLSLWLVSMQPDQPFTFLDDRIVVGDSLLGVSRLDQLDALHLDAAAGRQIHERWRGDPVAGVRLLLADHAAERERIADLPGSSLAELATKRERLAVLTRQQWRVGLISDLVVAGSLAYASRGPAGLAQVSKDLASLVDGLVEAGSDSATAAHLRERVGSWLGADLPPTADPRKPLHWPLEFPEVFGEHGGFDAVVGNSPYLGGKKITGVLGTAYRNELLHTVGRSVRGNADLVAYFVLRAHQLLNERGRTGLVATNTLAQGDTREVGLDQLVADGVTIVAATKSEPWPAKGAVLEYCAVWTSRPPVADETRLLDGRPVASITSALDAGSRASGPVHRLAANSGIAFIGSLVLGMGFTMEPDRARQLIAADPRNAEVLFPYLNGEDLNSRPDSSARRWVINFHDWSDERAASYPAPFAQVRSDVKPQRDLNNKRNYRERWWQYGERCPGLYRALGIQEQAVAITLVSKVVMPVLVPARQVFAHKLAIFARNDKALLGLLSSSPHYWWAIRRSSTMKADLNYSPTDVFETFPRPELTEEVRALGDRLDRERRELMLARQAGLTATYNLVHDPSCVDADIVGLRTLHRDLDLAVLAAYGWSDLDPGHDHHPTRQGVRWTVDETTRQEMLDRLLELNQERFRAEQAPPVTTQEELV